MAASDSIEEICEGLRGIYLDTICQNEENINRIRTGRWSFLRDLFDLLKVSIVHEKDPSLRYRFLSDLMESLADPAQSWSRPFRLSLRALVPYSDRRVVRLDLKHFFVLLGSIVAYLNIMCPKLSKVVRLRHAVRVRTQLGKDTIVELSIEELREMANSAGSFTMFRDLIDVPDSIPMWRESFLEMEIELKRKI